MMTAINLSTLSILNVKDTASSAYIPNFAAQAKTAEKKNFMEEFEKVAINGNMNGDIQGKDNYLPNNSNKSDPGKDNPTGLETDKKGEEKIYRENSGKRDQEIEERGPRENKRDEQTGENEKANLNKDKKEKTDNSKNQAKEQDANQDKKGTGEKGEKGEQGQLHGKEVTKRDQLQRLEQAEIIRKSQLQQAENIKVKEELTDQFGEAKKIDTTHQAEKVILKSQEVTTGAEDKGIKNKLLENVNGRLEKANEIKAGDEKKDTEAKGEKNQQAEADAGKKDNKAIVTPDVKVQKNDQPQEKTPNINFLSDLSKNLQQMNDVKVRQVFTQSNLFEQYVAYREQITNSLANSIKFMVSSGDTRATLQLHPPELGRVQVELIVNNHQVQAKINTENAAVKEVILTNLDQLKSNLANAGTQISKFDVEVGGFKNQFEQNFSHNKSGSGGGSGRGGTGYESAQESGDINAAEVTNYAALTFYLGRQINCLI